MREPCIRDFAGLGIVGDGDQFAELAAGLPAGEYRGTRDANGGVLLSVRGGRLRPRLPGARLAAEGDLG